MKNEIFIYFIINILIIAIVIYCGIFIKIKSVDNNIAIEHFFNNRINNNYIHHFAIYYNSYLYFDSSFNKYKYSQLEKSKTKILLPNKHLSNLIYNYIIEKRNLKTLNKIELKKLSILKGTSDFLSTGNNYEFNLKTYNELENYYCSLQYSNDFIESTSPKQDIKHKKFLLSSIIFTKQYFINLINTNTNKIIFEIFYYSFFFWLFILIFIKIKSFIFKLFFYLLIIFLLLIPYMFFDYGIRFSSWSMIMPEFSTFNISGEQPFYDFGNTVTYRTFIGILTTPTRFCIREILPIPIHQGIIGSWYSITINFIEESTLVFIIFHIIIYALIFYFCYMLKNRIIRSCNFGFLLVLRTAFGHRLRRR